MAGARQAGSRILLVEDHADTRAATALLLEDRGYVVTTAENGREALRRLRGGDRPDLILLDLMMPVLDGWSFLDLYRQLPGPHAPVIVITAAAREARSAVAHAVEEVVPKPFSVDKVLALVRQYTGQSGN